MFVRSIVFFTIGFLLLAAPSAPPAQAEEDFLARAVPLAQKSQRDTSVPASVTLAQAIWETGRGASSIGEANNYFGIKAGTNVGPIARGWVWAWTREWNGTRYVDRREKFRQYDTMEDSFRDHALLLAGSPRYIDAMQAVDDPREFARRIAAAGYATSPTYAADIIRLMDAENLYQYDLPRNGFALVGHSEPLQVYAGDIFQVYFDTKNTGFGTWSPAADYYLESVNGTRFGENARQELDQLVPPDRVKRWAITMFAPREPGTYSTTWRFKHGAQQFGPELSVQVEVRSAPVTRDWVPVGGLCLVASVLAGGVIWFRWVRRKKRTLRYKPG